MCIDSLEDSVCVPEHPMAAYGALRDHQVRHRQGDPDLAKSVPELGGLSPELGRYGNPVEAIQPSAELHEVLVVPCSLEKLRVDYRARGDLAVTQSSLDRNPEAGWPAASQISDPDR